MVNDCKSSSDSYCKYCQRFGQFLPVRISIGLKNESIDILKPKPSIIKDLPKLPSGYEYILRRLNEGYIYTFSEKWKFPIKQEGDNLNLYKVDESGYIKELNKGEMDVDINPEKCLEFSATEKESKTSAGISLSDVFLLDLYPEEGADVSIVYTRHRLSDQAHKNLNDDESIQNKIMQKFDIQGNGTYEFLMDKRLSTKVLDNLQVSQKDLMTAFDTITPWDYVNILKNEKITPFTVSKYLKEDQEGNSNYTVLVYSDSSGNKIKFDHIVTGDAIIVLNDPVGLMDDMINIINYNKNNIFKKKYEVEYQTFLNINELKKIEYSKIYSEEIQSRLDDYYINYKTGKVVRVDRLDRETVLSNTGLAGNEAFGEINKKNKIRLIEEGKFFTNKDFIDINKSVESKFNIAWNKLKNSHFHEKRMEEEICNIEESIQLNLDIYLKPLILLYIEFFKSDILLQYFDSLFDHKSFDSSKSFLNIFTKIIQNMDGFSVVSDYFVELMMQDDLSNSKNYFLRVFTFDNENVKDGVSSLNKFLQDNKFSDLSGFVLDEWSEKNSINSVDSFLTFVVFSKTQLRSEVEMVSNMIGGSLIRVTSKKIEHINGQILRNTTLLSFELFSGKTFRIKDYNGSYRKILNEMMSDFNVKYSKDLDRVQLKKAKNEFKNSIKHILDNQMSTVLSNSNSAKYATTIIADSDFDIKIDSTNFDKNIKLDGVFNTKDFFLKNYEDEILDAKKINFENYQMASVRQNNVLRGFGILSLGMDILSINSFVRKLTKENVVLPSFQFEFLSLILNLTGSVIDSMVLLKNKELLTTQSLSGFRSFLTQSDLITHQMNNELAVLKKKLNRVLYIDIVLNIVVGFYKVSHNTKNHLLVAAIFVSTSASILSSVSFLLGRSRLALLFIGVGFLIDLYIKHEESKRIYYYLRETKWGIYNKNWNVVEERKAFLDAIDTY